MKGDRRNKDFDPEPLPSPWKPDLSDPWTWSNAFRPDPTREAAERYRMRLIRKLKRLIPKLKEKKLRKQIKATDAGYLSVNFDTEETGFLPIFPDTDLDMLTKEVLHWKEFWDFPLYNGVAAIGY